LTIHSSVSIDAARSSRMVPSAVVTTSASSATMKEAVAVSSNTQVRAVLSFALLMLSFHRSERFHDRKTSADGQRIRGIFFAAAESFCGSGSSWRERGRAKAVSGTMTEVNADAPPLTRDAFDRLLGSLRPKLHRYCARMTGSVIDGEDVVQEAMLKAIEAFGAQATIGNPEAWLVRIAHNAALDHLRRRARRAATDEELDMIVDPAMPVEERQVAQAALHSFMRLPVAQRSSVVLMEVLGYSLEEIGGVTALSIPAIKASLHRGRARLRELAQEPDDRPLPRLAPQERALLSGYIDRFNARDFDAVRDMLAEEVRLDLVNKTKLSGRSEVSRYFTNYSKIRDWHLVAGFVDRHPALLVRDPNDPSAGPAYFVLLGWADDRIMTIRDFYYARYAMADAEVIAYED
jgi:RNA polymerase sigma-70 factor (ECF subfamily)